MVIWGSLERNSLFIFDSMRLPFFLSAFKKLLVYFSVALLILDSSVFLLQLHMHHQNYLPGVGRRVIACLPAYCSIIFAAQETFFLCEFSSISKHTINYLKSTSVWVKHWQVLIDMCLQINILKMHIFNSKETCGLLLIYETMHILQNLPLLETTF